MESSQSSPVDIYWEICFIFDWYSVELKLEKFKFSCNHFLHVIKENISVIVSSSHTTSSTLQVHLSSVSFFLLNINLPSRVQLSFTIRREKKIYWEPAAFKSWLQPAVIRKHCECATFLCKCPFGIWMQRVSSTRSFFFCKLSYSRKWKRKAWGSTGWWVLCLWLGMAWKLC